MSRLVTILAGTERIDFDWGEPHQLGSAAFWVEQARRALPQEPSFQLGRSLAEEVLACLLGGHGMPASVALAAFERLRTELDLSRPVDEDVVERLLLMPLTIPGTAGPRRYRFPRQRAARITTAVNRLVADIPPTEPLILREWLLDLPGIGPKTASWIVRNHTGSDAVAIIDIHIRRAGLAAGFFRDHWKLPRDYRLFEEVFLAVAHRGEVPASHLDAYMWFELQRLGRAAAIIYGDNAC
jgi:N-glycosylase/DNA lyase